MKLNDALRGAADRAPLGDATVSTGRAGRRVRGRRIMRAGTHGVAGLGAVALVVVAVAPWGHSMSARDGAPEDGVEEATAEAAEDVGGMGGGLQAQSAGICGMTWGDEGVSGTQPEWTFGDDGGVTVESDVAVVGDDAIELELTAAFSRTTELIAPAPDAVVTWEDIVVASVWSPELDLEVAYSTGDGVAGDGVDGDAIVVEVFEDGEQTQVATTVALDNCWDGASLPAGDYRIHQAWTLGYPLDGDRDLVRVGLEPVDFTVEGEQLDDPFAQYLGTNEPSEPVPTDPVPLPQPEPPIAGPEPTDPFSPGQDTLTPALARELYEASKTSVPWDMAAGTQRYLLAWDSRDPSVNNYVGCAWDTGTSGRFPSTSSQMDLLDVQVTLPSTISVSYGYVVNNNPLISATVTNTSSWPLKDLWTDSLQLYLMRDGEVVGLGYPHSLTRYGYGAVALDGTSEASISIEEWPELAPGAVNTSQFLWRDVERCWEADQWQPMEPGTYTVLSTYSVHLYNQVVTGDDDMVLYSEEAGATDGLAQDLAVIYEEEPWDSVELQVWTSHGTVTITG